MGELGKLLGNPGAPPLPFVLSSGVGLSRIEGVAGELLDSTDHSFFCYDVPQTLADVIITAKRDGSAFLSYHVSAPPCSRMVLPRAASLSEAMLRHVVGSYR